MPRPDCPTLGLDLQSGFLQDKDLSLQWEALQTLALRADPPSQTTLSRLVRDPHTASPLKAEAIWGLAQSAPQVQATRDLLISCLDEPTPRRQALRSLRGAVDKPGVARALLAVWDKETKASPMDSEARRELADQLLLALGSSRDEMMQHPLPAIRATANAPPRSKAEWRAILAGPGDPEEGRRVFFHPNGPRCFACHRVDGRGGVIGPDLSNIGRGSSRDKLME